MKSTSFTRKNALRALGCTSTTPWLSAGGGGNTLTLPGMPFFSGTNVATAGLGPGESLPSAICGTRSRVARVSKSSVRKKCTSLVTARHATASSSLNCRYGQNADWNDFWKHAYTFSPVATRHTERFFSSPAPDALAFWYVLRNVAPGEKCVAIVPGHAIVRTTALLMVS